MKLSVLSGNRPAWYTGFIIVLLSLSFQFTNGSTKSTTKYSDPDNSFSNEVDGDEGDDGVCMKDESQTCPRKKFYSTVRRWRIPVAYCSYLDVPYNYTEDEYERMVKEDAFSEDFDHRKENQIMCPSIIEISNQGSCESCWAVAATDVMTDRLCIMSQGAIKRRHSVADLLTCCEDCTFKLNQELGLCGEGGSQRQAWMYWVQKGIATGHYKHQTKSELAKGCRGYDIQPCEYISREEWDQKYGESSNCTVDLMHCPEVTTQPTCEDTCDESDDERSNHILRGEMCYILKRKFDGKENLIKAEIKKNGPVHAFMTVYKSFYKHFSETINEDSIYLGDPTKDDLCPGGHSIRIVGWGKKNGRNYWIAANSWGEKWGLNGFFHLDFNHDKELGSSGGKNLMYAGIPEFE